MPSMVFLFHLSKDKQQLFQTKHKRHTQHKRNEERRMFAPSVTEKEESQWRKEEQTNGETGKNQKKKIKTKKKKLIKNQNKLTRLVFDM